MRQLHRCPVCAKLQSSLTTLNATHAWSASAALPAPLPFRPTPTPAMANLQATRTTPSCQPCTRPPDSTFNPPDPIPPTTRTTAPTTAAAPRATPVSTSVSAAVPSPSLPSSPPSSSSSVAGVTRDRTQSSALPPLPVVSNPHTNLHPCNRFPSRTTSSNLDSSSSSSLYLDNSSLYLDNSSLYMDNNSTTSSLSMDNSNSSTNNLSMDSSSSSSNTLNNSSPHSPQPPDTMSLPPDMPTLLSSSNNSTPPW
ncbi:hypothetical protein BC939DRAFT_438026 [Gamsiella multidivaricata]|uniref:uncharacterized protein n=1 Tax=Gamsiella multidivaricata TaxID=101098 RepID=UPI0022212A84|nr:uncharacterized protein BC939DRAFT_438026 [Gamsiella multidivaricata]KAI7831256.1 hypothetical protein BC939DRAFT_438026 [Gamsiella multidivaricata]